MDCQQSVDDFTQLQNDLISDGFVVETLHNQMMSVKGNVVSFDINYQSQQKRFDVIGSGRVLFTTHDRCEVANFLNLMNVM